MMPLSYQNIGFTFILMMVICLVINEAVRYFRQKHHKAVPKSHVVEKQVRRDSIS